jgi:hypothetical protein
MTKLLAIYLNDQLALGVGFRELARRAAKENAGTELGDALGRVATGIAEDIATFERIMNRLGVARSRVKPVAAIAGERVGRLKPNGSIRSYSPLSRFTELDFLTMAIANTKQLWATLRDLAGLGTRLQDVDFEELIARAQRQFEELEPFRLQAGAEALRR